MSSRRQTLLARVNWYLNSSLKHITELITGNKFYFRVGCYRQVSLYFTNGSSTAILYWHNSLPGYNFAVIYRPYHYNTTDNCYTCHHDTAIVAIAKCRTDENITVFPSLYHTSPMQESGRRQVFVSLSLSAFGCIHIAASGLPWLRGSYRLPSEIYEKTLDRNASAIILHYCI